MGILDGKCAVITGSGRGLGKAYAELFAKEGAKVVVNDIDADVAEETAAGIKKAGGTAVVCAESVYPYDSAGKIIQKCVDSFGRIDILVNNAGIVRDKTVWNMTVEEFDAVINVHLKGTFYCGQHAIRLMRAQRSGAILNIISGAHHGNFGQSNYSAAKGGIASMTYTWAVELARSNIRVNCVAPSGDTRMTASIPDAQRTTARRALPPEWTAPLIAYLCSDEAFWVHGQAFNSTGEMYRIMRQPTYHTGMFKPGGWDIPALRENFKRVYFNQLENFGLGKPQYAFYNGLPKPEEKK